MSNSITNKLYRYESLLKAIDFFTQRFNLEQLAEFAFEFSNEIVTLNSSALFMKEEQQFVLKKTRFYDIKDYKIDQSAALEKIPLFHGHIITSNFENFFAEDEIANFDMKLVIPLIIDSELFGFIISNGKIINGFDEDDFNILNALMRLYNNALENSRHFEDLKMSNAILDQKLFNLFIINQSTKVLLSELNIDQLTSTATDVFSEVSGSQVTSLGIYDELTQRIKLSSYRNVRSFTTYKAEFELHTTLYKQNKVVLEVEKDLDVIKSLFVNWEEFLQIEAKYIILIVKDKILGFVTLSDSMSDNCYDESMFELIESLAASTYIAISNAKMFKIINEQKERIEKKLNTLVVFNKLTKTINHCTTKEELCRLTLKSLQLHFGIKKAFISFKTKDAPLYKIIDSIGVDLQNNTHEIHDFWVDTLVGETVSEFSGNYIGQYFNEDFMNNINNECNCVVISPILFDYNRCQLVNEEHEGLPFGYLVVLDGKENLKEEEVLLIDTITKNITPVLYQMNVLEDVQENFVEDQKKLLFKGINKKLTEKKLYEVDFYLYYKKHTFHPFIERDTSNSFQHLEHYVINEYIFVLSYKPLEEDGYKQIPVNTIEDLYSFVFDE